PGDYLAGGKRGCAGRTWHCDEPDTRTGSGFASGAPLCVLFCAELPSGFQAYRALQEGVRGAGPPHHFQFSRTVVEPGASHSATAGRGASGTLRPGGAGVAGTWVAPSDGGERGNAGRIPG